jgi:hypothetical protein
MNQSPSYRKAFFAAIVINVVLLAGLGYLWWTQHRPSDKADVQPTLVGNVASPAPTESREAQLAPIQLTSQRMQSIGVRFGTVAYKNVSDEIRVTGNVDADETRISSIQVRFPGWIRKI